jgi:hypothetical protein
MNEDQLNAELQAARAEAEEWKRKFLSADQELLGRIVYDQELVEKLVDIVKHIERNMYPLRTVDINDIGKP